MTRISSKSIFFHKRVFPALWFGVIGLIIATVTIGISTGAGKIPIFALLIPIVMMIVGYIFIKKLIFTLVDDVYDCGTTLIVKSGNVQDEIAFHDIINLSYEYLTNPPRVTVTLRKPSRFGSEFTFLAPRKFRFLAKDPEIEKLIFRIDEERRKT